MASLTSDKKRALDFAFFPRSVAVFGASDQPFSFGLHFLQHLIDHQFPGKIYPVNPNKDEILGLQCYPTLMAAPGDVEYVICCVPTGKVLSMLDECAAKKVKIVHLFTARLSETGRPAAMELEKQILKKARQHGIHLIGPNCMGVYSPAGHIAFAYDLPHEAGKIGIVSQSGGAACLLMQQASLLGLRFSKAVSYGNALDLDECDILEYFIEDEQTEIIAAYFEGVRDGARFMQTLKKAAAKKPVIAIKGGRGKAGTRAVASHTAAIAGIHDIWKTAFQQAGVLEVKNLDEMVNMLQLFYRLPPLHGRRAAVIGGGGGKAVIAADLVEDAGLEVPPLSPDIRHKLKEMVPDLWDWLGNPVDTSILGDSAAAMGELPNMFAASPDYDFMLMQTSEDNPMGDDLWVMIVQWGVDMAIKAFKQGGKPVISTLSGGKPGYEDLHDIRWKTLAEERSKLVRAGVPVYDTMPEAVASISKYIGYWKSRRR